MPDQSLSRSPWECFLPASSEHPLLVLGEATPAVLALESRFEIGTQKEAGPFGAVIRLPGGPSEESEAFQTALSGLAAEGSLLWFWRLRRPRFERVPGSGFPRPASIDSYHVRGRAMWPEALDPAQPISKTYQIDLASDWLHARLRPLPLPHLRLTVVRRPSARPRDWLGAVLAHVQDRDGAPVSEARIARIDATQTGVAVVQLSTGGETKWALKAGLADRAAARIGAHVGALKELSGRSIPPVVRAGLPVVLGSGHFGSTEYVMEEWLPGQPAVRWMLRPRQHECEDVLDRAVEWVTALHESTQKPPGPDFEHRSMVRTTLIRVSEWAGGKDAEFAGRLADFVDRRLTELRIGAVYGHGDYWLANLLVDGNRVTGVLDWDRADPRAPPLEDVLSLLCLRKGLLTRWNPGERLAAILTGAVGRRDRIRLRDYVRALNLDPKAVGPLALLYWVRFLAGRMDQWDRDRRLYSRMYVSVRRALGSDPQQTLDPVGERLIG